MLNSLDDKFVIARDIEDGSTGSGVRQLDQWLVTQRILQEEEESALVSTCWHIQNSNITKLSGGSDTVRVS